MRFLIAVLDTATGTGTPGEMAAIDAFNARLRADGHWVLACGVASPADATVIDARGPEPVVVPGPAVASAEYMSGFWIIEAPDAATATELATAGSRACNRRVALRAFL